MLINHKKGQNHNKKLGENRAIFQKLLFKRACLFKNRRLLYTDIYAKSCVDWGYTGIDIDTLTHLPWALLTLVYFYDRKYLYVGKN